MSQSAFTGNESFGKRDKHSERVREWVLFVCATKNIVIVAVCCYWQNYLSLSLSLSSPFTICIFSFLPVAFVLFAVCCSFLERYFTEMILHLVCLCFWLRFRLDESQQWQHCLTICLSLSFLTWIHVAVLAASSFASQKHKMLTIIWKYQTIWSWLLRSRILLQKVLYSSFRFYHEAFIHEAINFISKRISVMFLHSFFETIFHHL